VSASVGHCCAGWGAGRWRLCCERRFAGVPDSEMLRARSAPADAAAQERAAVALATLLKGSSQDSVRECSGVAALVGLLAPGGSAAVHEQAAAALYNLCIRTH